MADEYSERCGPLLTKTQRQYIDHRTGYTEIGFASSEGQTPPEIDSRPREIKSQIKNEKAVSNHVSKVLQAFASDMQRIEQFYTSIEQDREAFIELLYEIELTIKSLNRIVERWKLHADIESDRWEQVEQAWKDRQMRLQDILSPLVDGLEDSESPRKEYHERIDALKKICEKELAEVFRYIEETPEEVQISEKKLKQNHDGWIWQKWTTEYLEQKYELVNGDEWGQKRKQFTLTEKGKIVYNALESFLESPYLDEWQEEGESRQQAAFKALSEPHPIDY